MMTFLTSAAGVAVPAMLYGTAWKRAETAGLVALAIERGFRGLDTACQPKHYDEAAVGAGVAASLGRGLRRSDLYLQTKFTPVSGHDPNRIPYDPRAPVAQQVNQSFSTSLRNLGTDFVDCLVLHSPLANFEQTRVAWQAMETLVDTGGVRQIGISNCYSPKDLEALYLAARIKPAIVQNRFYAATGYDREIRAFCREREVLYQSFWTLSANALLLAHPTVVALATTHSRTPAQIVFRFLTQIGVVPLTGTRSEAHMAEDLAIFEFEMPRADVEAIDALLSP
jgi:diketogulonate reductase-like aldo/keto reductase